MPHAPDGPRAAPRRPLRCFSLAAALLSAMAAATPAAAHTRLESSTPAAGSTVGDSLREVRLRFTRPVSEDLTRLVLMLGADTVAAGPLGTVPGTEGLEYAFALPGRLRPGAYVVHWRTAGADGHVIRGDFAFIVAGDAAAAPDSSAAAALPGASEAVEAGGSGTSSSAASALPVLVRWGGFLALLGMIGAVAFNLFVLRRLRGDSARERVVDRAAYGAWYLAAGAAALSALTLVLRLWIQSAQLNGAAGAFESENLDALLTGTVWGGAWVLQAIATVAFFLGLMVARAPHGRSVGWLGAAAAAVLVSAVPALSGHAAAEERLTALAIVSDTLHVLGAGVWMGTLAAVLAAGVPAAASAPEGEGMPVFAAMVRGFSPVALVGAGAVAATGIVNSLFHVDTPRELFGTSYGLVLLLKLALLGVVAALGFYNWKRVLPDLDDEKAHSRLRRSSGIELAVGTAVVLVTAVLVALPTP